MAQKYTTEQRANVIVLLEQGLTPTEISNTTKIPRTTVSEWKRGWLLQSSAVSSQSSAVSSQSQSSAPDPKPQQAADLQVTELLREVEAANASMQAQIEVLTKTVAALARWCAPQIAAAVKALDSEYQDATPLQVKSLDKRVASFKLLHEALGSVLQ